MGNSRETVISNIICIVLVLSAGVVRLAGYHYGTFSFNAVICALFTGAAFIWVYQLMRRILQQTFIILLMFFSVLYIGKPYDW